MTKGLTTSIVHLAMVVVLIYIISHRKMGAMFSVDLDGGGSVGSMETADKRSTAVEEGDAAWIE